MLKPNLSAGVWDGVSASEISCRLTDLFMLKVSKSLNEAFYKVGTFALN